MRFNILTQAVTALAFSATAYAAAVPASLTPAQIVTALQGLTAKANAVKTPVNAMNADSAAAFLTGGGPIPAIIAGIQDIAVNAQAFSALLQQASNIPSGNSANSVIAAYQQFASTQQQVLSVLNQRLPLLNNSPTVAAPINAALNNLSVALTNLFNQLTARLSTQAAPGVAAPTNALQAILNQVISAVQGLLQGLNLDTLLGGLLGKIPVVGGVVGGATGGSTGGATGGLLGLPFPNLPISGLIDGLQLGSLPILGQLLGGTSSGGSSPLSPITGLLNTVLGGLGGGLLGGIGGGSGSGSGGFLGGILAKRAEVY